MILGVGEEEWESVPLGHAAGTARLGRHGPAGRAARRPRGAAGRRGEPGRVPGDPACAGPVRPGRHGPHCAGLDGRRCADSGVWRAARIDPHWPPSVEQRAFLVFQLAQVLGLSPDVAVPSEQGGMGDALARDRDVHRHSSGGGSSTWLTSDVQRCRRSTPSRCTRRRPTGRPQSPRFQAVCCLDEREESFRRHLEELAPDVETFGVAGFYSVAMYYRGAADAHFTPLCPVVIRPQHLGDRGSGDRARRDAPPPGADPAGLGTASLPIHEGSRGFAAGRFLVRGARRAGLISAGGPHSFPAADRADPPDVRPHRADAPADPAAHSSARSRPRPTEHGMSASAVAEMTDAGRAFAPRHRADPGFARLLLLHGHGSDSQNNPHNSAYNCGACGGAAGGPNARAMAQILNDPRVREGLADARAGRAGRYGVRRRLPQYL